MITQTTIQAIKNNMDIVEIISEYIQLNKSGANFKACCPFHGEKTASLTVSPAKQIFHCFGCKQGGDAIQFVMDYEKLTYPEALEKIATVLDVTVEHEAGSEDKYDYKRFMEQVNGFYVSNLAQEHIEYLHGRGLTDVTIKEWGIGFAPRNPRTQQFLEQNFLSLDLAKEVGVMAQTENRIYARFSERVMFPIKSHTGQIVGFAGRTLKTDKKIAKYLNSPDTKLFDKSKILFGFNKAKEHIYKTKKMVIHEGQLDVVLVHQEGFRNTVATQGTALTEKHLPQLKKTGAYIVLAYDGDNAGQAAALKGAILLSVNGFDGAVALFPNGDDPAEMMATGRAGEYEAIINSAIPLIEFVLTALSARFNLQNPHEKNNALGECIAYLKDLNVVIATEYIHHVSKLLGISEQLISLGEIKKHSTPAVEQSSTNIEDSLLFTMYMNPSLIDGCINICHESTWANIDLYWSIVQHKVTQNMMSGHLLDEKIVQLEAEPFMALVKQKQRSYLLELRKGTRDFDVIIGINAKLKEVS